MCLLSRADHRRGRPGPAPRLPGRADPGRQGEARPPQPRPDHRARAGHRRTHLPRPREERAARAAAAGAPDRVGGPATDEAERCRRGGPGPAPRGAALRLGPPLEARPKSRRRSFGAHAAHLRVQRPRCSLTHTRCARSAARRFTRIWATWIAESPAEGFRPRLLRVRLALAPETPGFLAVPARGHRAPAAGVVLRSVVEGPSTRLRAAQLEPAPVLIF